VFARSFLLSLFNERFDSLGFGRIYSDQPDAPGDIETTSISDFVPGIARSSSRESQKTVGFTLIVSVAP
jgi:hypothetical protein